MTLIRSGWLTIVMAIALATVLALSVCGQVAQGPIQVRDAWSPATPASVAAVYIEITANEADTLLGGTAPMAQSAQMHETSEEDGLMRMRPLEQLPLKAGETVRFKRGGKHFMLMGLNQPLPEGSKFPMTLRFAKAGEIPITVEVRAASEGMH